MSDFIIENNVLVKYLGKEEKVIIPEGITKISPNAIMFKNNITEIKLPNSLIEIEDEAFLGMSNIKSIFIPRGVKRIGSNVFGGCFNLEEIIVDDNNCFYASLNSNCIIDLKSKTLIQGCAQSTIPNCVEIIGQRAFWKHKKLVDIKIPDNVIKIEKEAFFGTGISSIHLHKNIESISDSAFLGCYCLKNITIDKNNNYYQDFNSNAIVSKNDLRLILVGIDGIIPNNVKLIGKKDEELHENSIENIPFYNCTEIKTIKIPESVEYINMRVFEKCDKLKVLFWKGKLININIK